MKASDYLTRARQLPMATLFDLTADAPFVVLSPHPDDETLGAGGLIRKACRSGQAVEVVVLTDGSGSHPGSAEYPAPRLIGLRQAEVAQAAQMLGLPASRLHHLDMQDTKAPTGGRRSRPRSPHSRI